MRLVVTGWALAILGCGSSGRHGGDTDAGRDASMAHDAAAVDDAAAAHDAAAATDAATPQDAATDAGETIADLCGTRTAHPDRDVIDPDDPTYSDADWTNEEVRAAFETARAEDTDAYHAYRTARDRPDLMYCGFCPCGCSASLGHQSGIDCFKDMHGFG